MASNHASTSRTFNASEAKGGKTFNPTKAALVLIEFQNEFTTEGGKMHDAVKAIQEANDVLGKTADVMTQARSAGVKIMHCPILFKKDHIDNPNKRLGILAGCKDGELFTEGTWNAEICDAVKPADGDIIIQGKKGLDAFPGTDLEQQLMTHGIETVVLAGYLTNCCVESTMRTAFEKGFNVITLTDCTATTTEEGQKAAVEGTYGLFSTPMPVAQFKSNCLAEKGNTRIFVPEEAKGGAALDPKKSALVLIEFQNEFTTEGGKMHDAVKAIQDANDVLGKTANLMSVSRELGAKIMHCPISFKRDHTDNPNQALGILAGCKDGDLFTEGTWNAEICDAVKPADGDIIIQGKKGLDAFPGTDLEQQLTTHGIETVVLAGYLTNCCVESTMRTAYELGFNVITLTDCTATTTEEGQKAAVEGTYGFFSSPMTAESFEKLLRDTA